MLQFYNVTFFVKKTTFCLIKIYIISVSCKDLWLNLHAFCTAASALGAVLHCMMTEYADVDVRERARFYYLLVCSLAPKKVSPTL